MGKWVVLSILLLGSTSFANTSVLDACLAKDQIDTPKLYRNESGVVVCVNYGNNKAIEYLYNDTNEQQELGNKYYKPGALMGKKFHGFQHVQLPPHRTVALANEQAFLTGFLEEELPGISKIKKLSEALTEYFNDTERLSVFLERVFINKFRGIPKSQTMIFNTKSLEAKLVVLDTFDKEAFSISNLSDLEKTKVENGFNQQFLKPTVQTCNSALYDAIVAEINDENVLLLNGEYPYSFSVAQESIGMKALINRNVMSLPMNYNLEQAVAVNKIDGVTCDTLNECEPMTQYKELPFFTWGVIKIFGATQFFGLMGLDPNAYFFPLIHVSLAKELVNPKKFPGLFKDEPELKEKIEKEVIAPTNKFIRKTAENFVVDSIPCLL